MDPGSIRTQFFLEPFCPRQNLSRRNKRDGSMLSAKHVWTSVSRPINYHDRSQLTPFGTSCDHGRQPSTSERARNQQNEIEAGRGGGGGRFGRLVTRRK